jgi:hypothetical protein
MKEVTIRETRNNDTRIKGFKVPSIEELYYQSLTHIQDVQYVVFEYLHYGVQKSLRHDFTKLNNTELFRMNMLDLVNGVNFETNEWFQLHLREEPHHFIRYKGNKKIDLLDVIENCVDNVCSGLARNGTHKFNYNNIDENLIKDKLFEAYKNTQDYLVSKINVVKGE